MSSLKKRPSRWDDAFLAIAVLSSALMFFVACVTLNELRLLYDRLLAGDPLPLSASGLLFVAVALEAAVLVSALVLYYFSLRRKRPRLCSRLRTLVLGGVVVATWIVVIAQSLGVLRLSERIP